ncbi:Zinc finger BED domain-containing protein RICESLEEPER 1 [Linum grandiflorum]
MENGQNSQEVGANNPNAIAIAVAAGLPNNAAAAAAVHVDPQAGQQNQEVIPTSRQLKSNKWPHFERLIVNGELKAKCIYCRKQLVGHSINGTTHLRNHRNRCIQKKIHDGRQQILGPKFLGKGKPEMSMGQFNSEVSKKELGIMILMHEYPLSMVDHLYFKRFCCSLQPLFKVPSRNTMKKEIMSLYEVERRRILKGLDGNKGRVSIATDMWTTTNQKRGYMAVTAHYIDNAWNLRSHLLRFLYVPAPPTAERLATRLSECLLDWNVDRIIRSRCRLEELPEPTRRGLTSMRSLIIRGTKKELRDELFFYLIIFGCHYSNFAEF